MGKIELVELKADERLKAEELAYLAGDIWMEHYTPIIGRAQVEYMLERYQSAEKILSDISTSKYRYFMAYDDGKLVGYCAEKPEYDTKGIFLSKLYVEKSNRGRGISRRMHDKLLEIAAEEGLGHIWLTVNKHNYDSIDIYKKLGFVIVEELQTDIGNGFVMDDYKMRMNI